MTIKELVSDFQKQLQGRIGTSLMKPIAATIGNPTDDSVFASGTNRSADTEVYIHLLTSDDPTSYTTALRGAFTRADIYYGRPVTVVVNDAGDYVLYDVDSTRDAEYSVGIDELDSQKPVYLKQVMEIGTLHPIAGSLKFRVTSGMFGGDYYSGADSADFSSGTVQDTTPANITIPTTNGQAKGVLVQLDATTGTLEYKQSSEFSAILSLAQAYKASLLPLPDATRYRLGYLKLVKGITQFSYDHIWEAPELLSKGASMPLHNWTGADSPLNTDDETAGYSAGSLWFNGQRMWYCSDPTTGNAIWREVINTNTTQTLLSKTLTSPTIAFFNNANHNHTDSFGGGTLSAAAIASGTLVHERGGLEADVSAYSGLVKISGGATSQAVANTDYAAAAHASRHHDGGADALAGDSIASAYNGVNYVETSNTIGGQFEGIDNRLGFLQYAADGILFTDPIAQAWSNLNHGGGAYSDPSNGSDVATVAKRITIREDGNGSRQVRGWYFTAPAAPYIATFYISQLFQEVSGNGAGVFHRQNSTGELRTFCLRSNDKTVTVSNWNSATSINANILAGTTMSPSPRWWQIEDDNTNVYYRISADGINWITMYSVARTTFLTPDEIGFGADLLTASTNDLSASLLSLELT